MVWIGRGQTIGVAWLVAQVWDFHIAPSTILHEILVQTGRVLDDGKDMVAGIFHLGSGLGNQLHRYVGSRVMALDAGMKHGMVAPELFKGSSFMALDMGVPLNLDYKVEYPAGKVVLTSRLGIDLKVVDGEFQGAENFMHRIDEVREWLKVEPLEMPDDLCVIGYRGGEYKAFRDLYLPKDYWAEAIGKMYGINPSMRFEVHTDDPQSAFEMLCELLPSGISYIHDTGLNWRSVRFVKYLIIANSSFYILPALLNQNLKAKPLAPLYWAGHNKGYWQMPENNYPEFDYIL